MNGSLLTLVLTTVLAWQAEAPPETAEEATNQAIAHAVRRLGDAEFTTRRDASQFLWQQGRRAEEALRQAVQGPDVEVRLRARQILLDFEYGILPGVPTDVIELITQFRSGDSNARQHAVFALFAAGHIDRGIQLISLERGAESRRRLLTLVMQNRVATAQYATLERIEALVERVAPDQDEAWRRVTVGKLFFSAAMIDRLAEENQLEKLGEFLQREEDSPVRAQILRSVFDNSATLAAVLVHGDLPLLFRLADAAPEDVPQSRLLLQSLRREPFLGQILEAGKLGDLLARIESSHAALEQGSAIRPLSRWPALSQLFERRSVDELIQWLRRESNPQLRGELLAALMSSPEVQKKLADDRRLELIVDVATNEPEAVARRAYLEAMSPMLRNAEVTEVVRGGLWQLIKSDEDVPWRAGLAATLLRSAGSVDRGAVNIVSVATDKEEATWLLETIRWGESGGKSLREVLLKQPHAVAALVNGGFLDDLLDFAQIEPDSVQRSRLMWPLLSNPSTVAWLVETGNPEQLIAIVRHAPEDVSRSAYLANLVRNPAAISALADARQLDVLVSFCRQMPYEKPRRDLMARLLLSPQVVKYLAGEEMLAEHLQAMLSEPDTKERHAMIGDLVRRADVLLALDQAGLAETLVDAMEDELAVAGLELAEWDASRSPELLQMLVDHERIPLIVALVNASPGGATRQQHLGVLLRRPRVLRAVLEHVSLEQLTEGATATQSVFGGASPSARAAGSPAVLRILHENQQLDWLLGAAEDDPDTRYQLVSTMLLPEMRDVLEDPEVTARLLNLAHPRILRPDNPAEAYRLLSHAGTRRLMIAHGKGDQLLDLLQLARESDRDRLRNEILYSPTGLVVNHIACGELAAAERLVDEHATDGDEGRLALATLLVSSGKLQPRIAELLQRIADAAEPDQDDLRTLVYLHRAAGDLAAAAAAAERTADDTLVLAIAHERRDWPTAASQLEKMAIGPAPPFPQRYAPRSERHRRAERLGRRAAYWRLAGDAEKANALLDQIEQLADASEPAVQWDCAEALLLNDRLQEGLTLLERSNPTRAIELLSVRHAYTAALMLVGSDDGATFDGAWYDSLPLQELVFQETLRRQQRLEIAVQTASLLRRLGRDDSAETIVAFLESHIHQQPEPQNSQGSRRRQWELLACELYAAGMYRRVWHAAEQAITPGEETTVLTSLFTSRSDEAVAWWSYLRRMRGDDPVHETLRQIHYLLHPAHPGAKDAVAELGDFEELVQAASDVSELEPHKVSEFLTGLATSCIKRGQVDLALRVLDPVREQPFALRTLARHLSHRDQHREAADAWLLAWQADPDYMVCLYLSGHALVQAGEVEQGEKRKLHASMSAMQSHVRHQMAWALYHEGLVADAAEQWKLVTRTAPTDLWEWNDAVRMLGDLAYQQKDHEQAADRWEQSMLMNLKSDSSFNDAEYYLRLPCIIRTRRAMVAAAEGDCAAALAQAEAALAVVPGQTSVAEELVPRLQRQGCDEAADALFARVHEHYTATLSGFPDSPELHNNLAWLNARCHRHLDEALAHARRAVERSPDNAGYVDTLAEVHFHLGNRDEAVRLSERSVALAPQNDTFRKHLERFRSEPLPE